MKKNKAKKSAAALFYAGENSKKAPIVSASGHGEIAEEIIAIAEECNNPLYENPELVEILSKLDIGEEIPRALFVTIAEIIAFAYVLQGKKPVGWQEKLAD